MSLIPWDNGTDETNDLRAALDSNRWGLLINGLIDYRTARDKGVNGAAFERLTMYVLDVFEGAPEKVLRALGVLVAVALGLDESVAGLPEALGRRWVEEVCSIAWQVRTELLANQY